MGNLRILLTALPILWSSLFTFHEFVAATLVGFLLFVGRKWMGHQDAGGATWVRVGLNALLLSILYSPILERWQATWLIAAAAILLSIAVWFIGFPFLLGRGTGSKWTLFVLMSVVIVPLAIGTVPTFLLFFSPFTYLFVFFLKMAAGLNKILAQVMLMAAVERSPFSL